MEHSTSTSIKRERDSAADSEGASPSQRPRLEGEPLSNSSVANGPAVARRSVEEETFVDRTLAQASAGGASLITQIPFPSRAHQFDEISWFMVDLHYQPRSTQGATPLVARCMGVYGWTETHARKVLQAYRQFLELVKVTKDFKAEVLAPPGSVGLMWEQHLLDNGNYVHDCVLLCGQFVCNDPDRVLLDPGELVRRRKTTEEAAKTIFEDKVDESLWETPIEDLQDENGDVAQEQNEQEAPPPAQQRDPNEVITVRVIDQTGGQMHFRIKCNTRFQRIYATCADRKQVDSNRLTFLLRGVRIGRDDTALSLGAVDNDRIDCLLGQAPVAIIPQDYESITIRVRDQTGNEVCYHIKRGTRLGVVFDAYATRRGVEAMNLRFLLDGERIEADQTPSFYDMENMGLISVMLE